MAPQLIDGLSFHIGAQPLGGSMFGHYRCNWGREVPGGIFLTSPPEPTVPAAVQNATVMDQGLLAANSVANSVVNTAALLDPTIEDRHDAHSRTVRRTIAFIEGSPDRDLSIAEIAAASRVSIGGVRLAFRRPALTLCGREPVPPGSFLFNAPGFLNAASDNPGVPARKPERTENSVPDNDAEIVPLLDQLESLTGALLGTTTVAAALQEIVEATTLIVPGADLISVTVRAPDGTLLTATRTDEVAAELDEVQNDAGEGPVLDAVRPGGPRYVSSDDLGAEKRWPRFTTVASGHGYRAIICARLLPATGSAGISGALTIYSRGSAGFTRADRHSALLLATHGSLALAHARTSELADLRGANLSRAIETRDIIGQAKGILMNRRGISADEAFDLLRRTSQDLNIKLVDVARALTASHDNLDQT